MKTKKYGLLGHPLGHSFSKSFHNERFERLGIDAFYDNFDLDDISKLPEVLRREKTLNGLNVTIPYKQAVMQFLDELDPLAERIGAVNTVKFLPGGNLKGYNTDIIGFTKSIKPMLEGIQLASKPKALVLGTGGASKAIFVALQQMGIEPIYVSRTASADDSAPRRLTYDDLNREIMEQCQVVVNCTPLGMFPKVDTCPDIPYEYLSSNHVCFDCVYNPAETLFMKRSKASGAAVKCGQEMLEGQAIASYEIWTSEE